MTKPCPYCATSVTGEVIAFCRGCGNPVPLGEDRREIEKTMKGRKPAMHLQTRGHKLKIG